MRRSRKRRNRSRRPQPQTLTSNGVPASVSQKQAKAEEVAIGRSFFGCYLLTSLSPRYNDHSYIGFTVNPKRRIRQHNGEITSGASTTKRKRPWEMVLCIHGFPTHVTALQFEWAWQHPKESVAVREAAATFKTLGGLANKIKLGLTMLTLPSWKSMSLTMSFFSTKYLKHTAGCPILPHQMKIHFCTMDDLPCYSHADDPHGHDDDDAIALICTEDVGNGRQLHLLDGLAEENCTSIDHESWTIPNVDEERTWEPRGIATLDSFSAVGFATLEKQMRLLHQVPSDVHGLTESSISHQIQVNEKIWSEGLKDSFSISKDDIVCISTDESNAEQSQPTYKQLFSILNDDIVCMSTDESKAEQSQPTDKQSPNRVAEMVRASSTEGIEVINLFTPSPDCRIIADKKKRRVVCDSPDIIDLTRSPLFVQL